MVIARREATEIEARALANPVRLRILRLLRFDQLTNAEIAVQLELNPATSLHHVRALKNAGLISDGTPRPGPNGITEKPYRDNGKSWTLEINEEGPAKRASNAAIDAFTAEITQPGAKIEGLTRLALHLNKTSLAELQARLLTIYDQYEQRQDPDGSPYALFTAIHRRPRPRRRANTTP